MPEWLNSLRRKLFFNLAYLGRPPWDSGISPPELLSYIESHPPGRALDLGCGSGTHAITLAQHGWQVVGVDFVRKAIAQARRRARQAGVPVDFRLGDVTRLEGIGGSFDLVLDIGCFHGLPPKGKQRYVQNLPRLLGEQGTFLLYAFVKSDPHQEGSGLTPEDLCRLQQVLHLEWRQDGFDRAERPSAWFSFRPRPAAP